MLSNSHRKYLRNFVKYAYGAVVPWLLALSPAHGAGLGGYEVQSSLGQTLRLVVQVIARPDEAIDTGCFRLNPYTVANDGLPQLTGASLAFDRRGNEPRLIITSARPILDPIVRVSLDVGCDTTLRRDLTLLLDPAPVIETQAQTTAAARPAGATIAPAARPAATAASDEGGRGAPAGGTGSAAAGVSPGAATGPARAGRAAPPAPSSAASRAGRESGTTAGKGPAPGTPPRSVRAAGSEAARQAKPAPAKAPAAQSRDRLSISTSGPPLESLASPPITPRLRLSTTLSDRSGQPPLPESVLSIVRQKQARLKAAPAEEDIPSLEAELVVLQKRTAEMRSQLDTVMAQMRSLQESSGAAGAGSAPAPLARAEPAPAATPVSSLPDPAAARWNLSDPRLQIGVLLGLFMLLGIVLLAVWMRRERSDSRRARRWNKTPYVPVTAPPVASPPPPKSMFGTNPDMERLERMSNAGERPPMPDSFAFTPFSTGHAANQLGVSDLAQATEKANVFVTLGRPEQAIDVLRDHIDHEPKPSPMAWLMLQDLYRQTNRHSEFAEVAQRFHLEFNSETPAWDQASTSPDPGLSGFPRLIAKIRDLWPRPECRDYIEELLYDNKGGSRIGFSLPAFRDLLLLYSIVDAHLLALETPERIDPRTGTVIPPPPPPGPPPHLAAVWAKVWVVDTHQQAPEHPAQSPLQLDVGLLSGASEPSALETGYPIIAEAIKSRWGKPGVAEYLSNLIRTTNDERGPSLSNESMAELIMLHDVAVELGEPEPGFSIE